MLMCALTVCLTQGIVHLCAQASEPGGSLGAVGRFPSLIDHDDDYLYGLPYGPEVSYPVVQSYGSKLSHRGSEFYTVDFGMDNGTPVHAARDGTVVALEDSYTRACWSETCAEYANFVEIRHDDGTSAMYFHLQQRGVLVHLGQRVERGELIALSGNTGYTNAPHLHFGVYRPDGPGARSIEVRFTTRRGAIAKPRVGARYSNVTVKAQMRSVAGMAQ